MDQSNDVDTGVSFDTSDLLFEQNQDFFSEIEEFQGFNQTEFNTDFQTHSLSTALQMPDTTQWEYNWETNQYNYPNESYNTEPYTQQEFSNEQYFQNNQEFSNSSLKPQMQYLQPPGSYCQQATQFVTSPNSMSDYYSGNLSSDSSPPHPTNQTESRFITPHTGTSGYSSSESTNQSLLSKPTTKQAILPKHNLGNLPNGLMKALTTVLTQTNNPTFKQLLKAQETTTTTTTTNAAKGNTSKARKLVSKAEPKSSETKKVPDKIPILKPVSNKPSLEDMRKKKAERMIRNREAALQSRKRKLEEQEALEDTCRDLQNKNVQLEKQVSFLEGRLSQIEETNRKLETQLAKFSKPSKVLASVCFLMFVSFIAISSWPTSQPFKALPSNTIPNIPQPVNELDWLLGPFHHLWKSGIMLFSSEQEKYELAISPKLYKPTIPQTPAVDNNKQRNTEGPPTNQKHFKSRIIPDHTMDFTIPEDLIISLPQQEWPPGVNSTQIHSDFVHFLKNQSVSREMAVLQNNNENKGRPIMLRFPPSDNPLYYKYLNETSFIFDSLQPEFQKKSQNLFIVTLDHAIWVPSRSTPNQTLSLIFPNHNEYIPSNYFSWTRWDCVVTGYQEFLTPIPSNY